MSSLKFKILLLLVCVILSQALTVGHEEHKKFGTDLNALRKAELAKHNEYRKMHKVPPLQLDDTLNKEAQKLAQEFAARDKITRLNHDKYGLNYDMQISAQKNTYKSGVATSNWYSQIKDYNFKKTKTDYIAFSFSQLVWKSTKKVGFGFVSSKKGSDFVVALYDPKGNIDGKYTSNVFPK